MEKMPLFGMTTGSKAKRQRTLHRSFTNWCTSKKEPLKKSFKTAIGSKLCAALQQEMNSYSL
jgi:hypothetical protein